MDHSLLKPSRCPNCQKVVEAHTQIFETGAVPEEGSISVCLYCQHISIFDEKLKLRFLTADEIKKCGKTKGSGTGFKKPVG